MSRDKFPLAIFLVKRIIRIPLLVLFIITITFVLFNLAPGSAVDTIIGQGAASAETRELIIRQLGLDKPVFARYLIYLSQTITGNLGYSYIQQEPVLSLILARLPNTLLLMASAIAFSTVFGVIIGVVSGGRPHSKTDKVLSSFTAITYSIPTFWLGQILIIFVGLDLRLLPVQGMTSPTITPSAGLGYYANILEHLVLPTVTIGTFFMALTSRLTRTNILYVMREDYIKTAFSKGLSERSVIIHHAIRNAIMPVVSIVGVNFSILLGGAVLTETVFAWPGLGRLLYDSLLTRDFPVVAGLFIVVSVGVVFATLIVDLIYFTLDPRARMS